MTQDHPAAAPSPLASVEFTTYAQSVRVALDRIGAAPVLAQQKRILIKPNLTEASPPPITTPVACVQAVIMAVREHTQAELVVAEGCGAAEYDTEVAFQELGYSELARRMAIRLVNLNQATTVCRKQADCRVFPEFHWPKIAFDYFIISVPVLKAHSLATITGSLKNMMGFVPPRHYQQGGHWKKSAFHRQMHRSIVELNRYRTPDLSILDASVGLAQHHLGGPPCSPPLRKVVAGFDPVQVDRRGAELLGRDWRRIAHLLDA